MIKKLVSILSMVYLHFRGAQERVTFFHIIPPTISIVDLFQLLKPFLQEVSQAYKTCAKYLQKKLPLQSETLQSLSAVDPIVRGHSLTTVNLRKLTHMMGHLLPPDADTDQEILRFNVDQALPSFQNGEDVVKWWAVVFNTGKYPALCQAVKAALSIFHGALVESSFSVMGNIIDQHQ